MRWQRHSDVDVLAWLRSCRRALPTLAVGACMMAVAGAALVRMAAPAESEEIIEGGEAVSGGEDDGRGMSASNPRVKPMLAAHPNQFVTICVAGCDGKPAVVQTLPKPLEKRSGAMRTTAAGPGRAAYGGADSDAVTCVAGCGGAPGQVVQRLPGLPPLKAPPAPGGEGNEPLDAR